MLPCGWMLLPTSEVPVKFQWPPCPSRDLRPPISNQFICGYKTGTEPGTIKPPVTGWRSLSVLFPSDLTKLLLSHILDIKLVFHRLNRKLNNWECFGFKYQHHRFRETSEGIISTTWTTTSLCRAPRSTPDSTAPPYWWIPPVQQVNTLACKLPTLQGSYFYSLKGGGGVSTVSAAFLWFVFFFTFVLFASFLWSESAPPPPRTPEGVLSEWDACRRADGRWGRGGGGGVLRLLHAVHSWRDLEVRSITLSC